METDWKFKFWSVVETIWAWNIKTCSQNTTSAFALIHYFFFFLYCQKFVCIVRKENTKISCKKRTNLSTKNLIIKIIFVYTHKTPSPWHQGLFLPRSACHEMLRTAKMYTIIVYYEREWFFFLKFRFVHTPTHRRLFYRVNTSPDCTNIVNTILSLALHENYFES